MTKPDRYAEAFDLAMDETYTRNTAVIALIGNKLTPGNITNWRKGRRPIPAEYAPAIGALLNVPPESISKGYERLVLAISTTKLLPEAHVGHVMVDRLEAFGQVEGPARLSLPDFLLRPRIGLTPLSCLRWTLQPSTALEPLVQLNALVFVDTRITEQSLVVDRGLYAYALHDRPDIRHIGVGRQGWALACHSKKAGRTDVPTRDLKHLRIVGAAVGWINPPDPSLDAGDWAE